MRIRPYLKNKLLMVKQRKYFFISFCAQKETKQRPFDRAQGPMLGCGNALRLRLRLSGPQPIWKITPDPFSRGLLNF